MGKSEAEEQIRGTFDAIAESITCHRDALVLR